MILINIADIVSEGVGWNKFRVCIPVLGVSNSGIDPPPLRPGKTAYSRRKGKVEEENRKKKV